MIDTFSLALSHGLLLLATILLLRRPDLDSEEPAMRGNGREDARPDPGNA